MPFVATWMELDIVRLSDVSQTEKEKFHMTSLVCEIEEEIMQMYLLTKQKETHKLRKQTYGLQGEEWGERIVREFGMDMDRVLYLKWITSKDLLYSAWNSARCYCGSLEGRRVWRRMDMCICMAESLHCSPEIIMILLISYTPVENKKFKIKKSSSIQFSSSVMSDSLQPHEPQHARPPCPSPTPRVYSDSCPLSRWCHPTISSSGIPISSCPKLCLKRKLLAIQFAIQIYQQKNDSSSTMKNHNNTVSHTYTHREIIIINFWNQT